MGTTMLTVGDEDDLLNDIEEGIQIAMYRRGYSADDIDPIKVNKLAYFAIQELGVPITYGWYKYGPAPVFDTQSARLEPSSETEISASEEPRIPDPGDKFYSPNEYAFYFEEDCLEFNKILQTPTKDYLREFYEDHAPKPYGSLYQKSTQVQVILDDIKEGRDWHTEAEDYYKSLNRAMTELYGELLSIDHMSEVIDDFGEYSRLLKDIIAEASTKDSLEPAQQRFIVRVIDFFYGGVWNYVALLISKNTVSLSPGDNDSKLLNAIDANLRELRSSVSEEIDSFRSQSEARGLLPEYYSDIQQEHADEGISEEKRTTSVEPFTKASAESFAQTLESDSHEIEGGQE